MSRLGRNAGGRALRAVLLTGVIYLLAAQSFAQEQLEPAWQWNAGDGIEWCQTVGRGEPNALLICDRNAKLQLLDLIRGDARIPAFSGGEGVLYAGQNNGVVYCYNRYEALAIEVAALSFDVSGPKAVGDRLLWRVGDAGNREQREGGDPEFLKRLVDAAATENGLLIVRSDGRIAELARRDGGVRWEARIERGTDATLLVRATQAVVVYRGDENVEAAFFDLAAGKPTAMIATIGASRPIWSALSDDGLLVAWMNRVMLCTPGQEPRRIPLRRQGAYRGAGLAFWSPSPKDAASWQARIIVADDYGLKGFDASSGAGVWTVENADARGGRRGSRSQISGDLVLSSDDRGGATAYQADDGQLVARLIEPPLASILSVGITNKRLFVAGVLQTRPQGREKARMAVCFTPLLPAGRWEAAVAQANQSVRVLADATTPRSALWPPGRLVLVEPRRILVYVLP